MKRQAKSILFILWLGLVCLTAGCAGPDEPERIPSFHAVVVDAEFTYFLDANGQVEIPFEVLDSDAFALSDHTITLRAVGQTELPNEVELLRVASKGDCYVALLGDKGFTQDYMLNLTFDVRNTTTGVVIRSNVFRVAYGSSAVLLTNFRFTMANNPTLPNNVAVEYNPKSKCFEGNTGRLLESMRLVASFDAEGRVTVNGVEQRSGESVNDFSEEVVYCVESGGAKMQYRVKVGNFTGLPVMIIHTSDGKPITSKEDWKDARIEIKGAGLFDDLKECGVEIRGRGNSTWGYDKKPYALKFPSKTSLLGMPKHKRWVLLANTMDRTMMRNRVAYHVAEQTSLAWTPRTEYVELFLNDKHVGNYLLTEQIRIDGSRIDIAELEPTDNQGEAITGGYVYEMDFHFDNVNQWWTAHGFPSSVKFPDEDDITPEQLAWAKDYFTRTEEVIYSSDFRDPVSGYAAWIDVQSFVDYWLVYEICINHELANPGSVYMHKDRGGKLTAGPIWDFDWGTFSYNASPQAKGRLFMTNAIWYGRLFQDDNFKRVAKERWQTLYPKFKALDLFIDEQYAYLASSAKKNFAIWNPATTGDVNGDERISFDDAVARMRALYVERIETLNGIFAKW